MPVGEWKVIGIAVAGLFVGETVRPRLVDPRDPIGGQGSNSAGAQLGLEQRSLALEDEYGALEWPSRPGQSKPAPCPSSCCRVTVVDIVSVNGVMQFLSHALPTGAC